MAEYKIEYKLDIFQGPLDLLLHLIEKNKIDIFDIPISSILEQYLEYIFIMEGSDLYVASEFIDMVAKLLYIKSKLLLPKEENEPDPREELVKILLDYSEIKKIADYLSERFGAYKDRYEKPEDKIIYEDKEGETAPQQTLDPAMLYGILMEIASRKRDQLPPTIESIKIFANKKTVTMAEKIISIIRRLYKNESLDFLGLLKNERDAGGRDDIVATFAAILELLKTNRIEISGSGILDCRFTLNKQRGNR
ncbi:MAG: segregation/condensation protein A [Oscillospiraceae bacterium]|nr:segregation/condensation protein A [Oscillospiraceae bacterium]